MSWYDLFARFYDPAIERIYRPYRELAFAKLAVADGGTLLDLACGTGLNLPWLAASGRHVIGVDASSGMLERARRRVARAGLEGVTLIEADARELSPETLGVASLDAVVCALGLTAIPDWERVLERCFDLLAPGGQFLIFDVHAERRVPQTRWVELIARADLSRKVWEPLAARASGFELEFLEGSPHVHGGRPIVASGFRPGGANP